MIRNEFDTKIPSVDERNYDWFILNLSDLINTCHRKFVIIYEESLRGVFSDINDAISDALTFARPGEFLIQQCVSKEENTEIISSLMIMPNLI